MGKKEDEKLKAPDKKQDKKKTKKDPSSAADSTGTTPGLIEAMVRTRDEEQAGEKNRLDQALFGNIDPATAMSAMGLTGAEGQTQGLAAPPPGGVYDPAAQMSYPTGGPGGAPVSGNTQALSAQGAAAPVEPYPELGIKERLLALGGLLPFVGSSITKPIREIEERRAKMEATDAVLVSKALELMDDNPDAAAKMMANKDVLSAFERRTGLDKESMEGLGEMSKNLPIKFTDLVRASEAEFGVDLEKGKATDAPPGLRERQGKIKDSLEQKKKEAGEDPNSVTDLDVFIWDAASKAGQDEYETRATREGVGLFNRVTGQMEEITPESMKASNIEIHPIKDPDTGYVIGYTMIDRDDIDARKEIWFANMLDDLKASIMAEMGITPDTMTTEQEAEVKQKAEKAWYKRAASWLGQAVFGPGDTEASVDEAVLNGIKDISGGDQQKIVPGTGASPAPDKTDKFFD